MNHSLLRPHRDLPTALLAAAAGFALVEWWLGPTFALPADLRAMLAYLTVAAAYFGVLGVLDWPVTWFLGREGQTADSEPPGFRRYLRVSLDHRVIGLQYLAVTLLFFIAAGAVALVIRTELVVPNGGPIDSSTYLSLVTEHSVTMLIVASSAIIGPFMNYLLPLMIGSHRTVFPRLEALGFWLYLLALCVLPTLFLLGGDQGGWTGYAPLADRLNPGHDAYIVTWMLAGSGLIVTSINLILTVWLLRPPGVASRRLNMTIWATLVAAFLAWLAAPIMIAVQSMVASDRVIGSALFEPSSGGNAYLYENLFWMFGHPEVYILAVPTFGLVLEVLAVFARRPVYAYRLVVLSLLAIGGLSWGVWQHHLFVSGLAPALRPFFMVSTELVSVPTGFVFFSALGTLLGARLRVTAAALFALAFFPNFLLGGITGVFLADVPADTQLHGSYFVQAHFHFILMGGTIFGLFAASYYWFPQLTGRRLDERLGKMHFWLMWAGFNGTFITLAIVGLMGMSRRVITYEPYLQTPNIIASAFALLIGLSLLPFMLNLYRAARSAPLTSRNVWGSTGPEWLAAATASAAVTGPPTDTDTGLPSHVPVTPTHAIEE